MIRFLVFDLIIKMGFWFLEMIRVGLFCIKKKMERWNILLSFKRVLKSLISFILERFKLG